MTTIDIDTARAIWAYDSDTGAITRRGSGRVATHARPDGRLVVAYRGASILAHRLAWLLHNGEWPVHGIDHIDGDPTNNRAANLRDVEQAINRLNTRRVRIDAAQSVVYPGVRYSPATSDGWPWLVKHHRDGKTICRTAPDLLSAVALKMRLQAGGSIPPRCRKEDPRRGGAAALAIMRIVGAGVPGGG